MGTCQLAEHLISNENVAGVSIIRRCVGTCQQNAGIAQWQSISLVVSIIRRCVGTCQQPRRLSRYPRRNPVSIIRRCVGTCQPKFVAFVKLTNADSFNHPKMRGDMPTCRRWEALLPWQRLFQSSEDAWGHANYQAVGVVDVSGAGFNHPKMRGDMPTERKTLASP